MLAFALAAFLLFGAQLVLVGANQDQIAARLALDLAAANTLGGSISLGLGLGLLVSGPLVDRLHPRPILVGGILVTGAALISVGEEMSWLRACCHVALGGFGAGAYETALNASAVEKYGTAAARPVALMHSAATAGAMATPLVIQWWWGSSDWVASFRAVGVAHLLLAGFAGFVALPRTAAAAEASDAPALGWITPTWLALSVAGFAYVGVEAAVTLQSVPWTEQALGLEAARGRSAISSFWLGLLAGRGMLVVLGRRADARALAVAGLGAALLFGSTLVSQSVAPELVTAALGCVLGACFPLIITLAGLAAPERPGTAVGAVAAVASIGGFLLPWASGRVGDALGISLAVGGLALPCLVLAAAAFAASRAAERGR